VRTPSFVRTTDRDGGRYVNGWALDAPDGGAAYNPAHDPHEPSFTGGFAYEAEAEEEGQEGEEGEEETLTDEADEEAGVRSSTAALAHYLPDEVLIPALGDAIAEEDVRQILAGHGIVARHSASASAVLSRLPLGFPGAVMVPQRRETSSSQQDRRRAPPGRGMYSADAAATLALRRRRATRKEEYLTDEDVDLAGLCFDPKGTKMYVGSVRAIAEWDVSGAGKSWFVDGSAALAWSVSTLWTVGYFLFFFFFTAL
jgi:hypothetical protein